MSFWMTGAATVMAVRSSDMIQVMGRNRSQAKRQRTDVAAIMPAPPKAQGHSIAWMRLCREDVTPHHTASKLCAGSVT